MAEAWIEATLPQVISTLTTQQHFKPQFSTLTTNADRVQFCLVLKEVKHWVGLFESKICLFTGKQTGYKCPKFAAECREKGNVHFRVHNFKGAIQFYSVAICYAPQIGVDNTSELALALGNRSAAYFQLGQHDNALKDINDALAFGYGQFKSATKLQLRKCDCLIRLGRASEAEEFLHFMQKPTNDEKDTKRWIELFGRMRLNDDKKKSNSNPKAGNVSLIEKLTNKGLFKSNDKMSSFSTKVAVQYDEVKGRHLVAQEDIQFGDIIAVSQPFVILLDSKIEIIKYCHHCCHDLLESNPIRPIPCISCSSVVYCSEECRTEATNSYHRYESGQYYLLVQLPKFARMSLRLLYRAGMDQIRSVVDSSHEDASNFSEQAEGHYSHVYQLVDHSNGSLKSLNISFEEMLKSSILVCLLVQLAKKSKFPIKSKEEEKLIGGILLRHLLQSRFNTFHYSPFNNKESPSFPVVLDLYPLYASTLNHSCKANARLELPSNNQHVCLLQAARSISAGTEITIPYLKGGGDIENWKIPELFKDRYLVKCFCADCAYRARNTPFGLTDIWAGPLEPHYLELSCRACGHLMELSSEHRSESELFSCTNCRLTMNNVEMKARYFTFVQLARLFYQTDKSDEKPDLKMLKIVEQIEAMFIRDSAVSCLFRNILGQYYLVNGQMDKWWSCAEHYISVYGRLHEKESVQLMDVLNIFQEIIKPIAIIFPDMMKVFEQQDSELYQRYLARLEESKQLNIKYNSDY